jgi:DNA-binding PadR family transcriptional regulator
MKAMPFTAEPPEPGMEFRLAHRLMGADSDLGRRLLGALVGRPRRFAELKPLLGKRTPANLTQALRRLTRDGLIIQRTTDWDAPGSKTHELTSLGILVLYHIVELGFVARASRLGSQPAAASV